MKKRRADEVLFEQLGLEKIELARALIMEGRVMSGDRKILRVSEMISVDEMLRVRGEIDSYVSRGAHKLKRAIEVFHLNLTDKVCVDIGASTGGFTDVMLRNGAKMVYSVDVGYNLLDYRLRRDERVVTMEKTNARFLKPEDFPIRPEFGATDVSFISLKAVLPAALNVIDPAGRFVALIKPQFEAPKEDVGEKGVVRNPEVHRRVLEDILEFIPSTGWNAIGLDYSPIRGPEGNIEFLVELSKESDTLKNVSVDATLLAAYDKFMKSSE